VEGRERRREKELTSWAKETTKDKRTTEERREVKTEEIKKRKKAR